MIMTPDRLVTWMPSRRVATALWWLWKGAVVVVVASVASAALWLVWSL